MPEADIFRQTQGVTHKTLTCDNHEFLSYSLNVHENHSKRASGRHKFRLTRQKDKGMEDVRGGENSHLARSRLNDTNRKCFEFFLNLTLAHLLVTGCSLFMIIYNVQNDDIL